MADLIAIGYPDTATADEAADEARRLPQDLIIQPDADSLPAAPRACGRPEPRLDLTAAPGRLARAS